MGKVCMSCFESYGNDLSQFTAHKGENGALYRCPKRNCTGNVVEIDDLMVNTIILLNEKGYYTKSCCSGHLEEILPTAHITFSEYTPQLPNIPKGYSMSEIITEDGECRTTITRKFSGINSVQLFQNILTNALQTYEWAIELPYAEFPGAEVYFIEGFPFDDEYEEEEEEAKTSSPPIDPEKLKKDIKKPSIKIEDFIKLTKTNNEPRSEKDDSENDEK